MDERKQLLHRWGTSVVQAARSGAFSKPIDVAHVRTIAGPRAGALEIAAGVDSGDLLRAMRRDDCALLRQFIPWPFVREPCAFMSGRRVRLEAGWPDDLAEGMIRLRDLNHRPEGGARWVVGVNERGATVIAALDDRKPHFLVSGETGSGKSVSAQAAGLQLGQDRDNQVVLLDGKFGESLRSIAHLPAVVGPVAVDIPAMRAALGWVCAQMRQRYVEGWLNRIVVVFDEFQECADDPAIVELLRRIAAQGRGAGVHLIACTHHPTVDAFGDNSTRRNLVGKLALRVGDWDASRIAVGGRSPRADYLLGAGDAYVVVPGTVHRTQCAYVDWKDFDEAPTGEWQFDEWPEFEAEAIGQELPAGREPQYTAEEISNAILAAMTEPPQGRVLFQRRFESPPGSDRSDRLLRFGRAIWDAVRQSSEISSFCQASCLPGNRAHSVPPQGGSKWKKRA